MTRIAPFNPRRFTSAIPHYVAGRPPYSMRLVERLARETGLGEAARTLDLGCGPGSLTLPLARFSGTTIGIDPDAAMIAAAQEAAEVAGLSVEWSVGSSLDLPDELAPLDLVTIGRAFHWMDRETTLLRLDQLVRPAERWRSSIRSCTRSGVTPGTRRSRSCASRTGASTTSTAGARATAGRST